MSAQPGREAVGLNRKEAGLARSQSSPNAGHAIARSGQDPIARRAAVYGGWDKAANKSPVFLTGPSNLGRIRQKQAGVYVAIEPYHPTVCQPKE